MNGDRDSSPLTVVPLAERRKASADPELIRHCRELLAAAEAGCITGLAAALCNSDQTITTVTHTNGNHFAMSHALSALWFRFQKSMADGAYEPGSLAPDDGTA